MEKNLRLRAFILNQISTLLMVVLISTFLSSMLSYWILQNSMTKWVITNNNKVLYQYAHTIDTLVQKKAKEIYTQVVADIYSQSSLNYYMDKPLKGNVLDTLKIKDYLKSIVESNNFLSGVGIFYINNNLLVTDREIICDLFYAQRREYLKEYVNIANKIQQSNTNSFYVTVAKNNLEFTHAIFSGNRIIGVLIINYKIDLLREKLIEMLPLEFGNVLVVNDDKDILFNVDGTISLQSIQKDIYMNTVTGKDGYYSIKKRDETYIVSYTTIGDWEHISITPINTYLEPVGYILKNLLISAIITLLTCFFMSMMLSFWKSKPMNSIVTLCESLNTSVGSDNVYSIIQNTLRGLISTVETQGKELSGITPILRDNFVHWFLKERPDNAGEIEDNIIVMQVKFPYKNFKIVAVKTARNTLTDEDDDFKTEYAIAEVITRLKVAFNTKQSFLNICKHEGFILGLCNFDFPQERFNKILKGLFEESLFGFSIYSAVGELRDNILYLSETIDTAVKGLRYSYIYPEIKHFKSEFVFMLERENISPEIQISLNNFLYKIKIKDILNCLKEFNNIVEIVRRKGCRVDEVDRLIQIVTEEIENIDNEDTRYKREVIKELYSCQNIISFSGVFNRRLPQLLEESKPEYSKATEKLIESAKKIIDSNLTSAYLSQQSVAEKLKVSTTYLSRIFPEIAGVTFLEYINIEKMKKSRELLLETNLNIREISMKLNYTTPQYFISRFKKYHNITPSMYREKQRAKG